MMQFIAWCVFGSSFIFFDTFCQLVLLLCCKFEGFAWSSDHITIFRDDHLNFSRPSCGGRPWGTGPLPGTLNVLLDNEGELTLINFNRSSFDAWLCLGTPIFDALLSLGTPGEILINFIRSSFDDQLCLGTAGFDALLSLGTPGETLLLAAGSKVQLEPHFLQVR